MSITRFAGICDRCGRRSEEYSSWPSCEVCMRDVCDYCDDIRFRTEDERQHTICIECANANAEQHAFTPDRTANHGLYCVLCGASETDHHL